MRSSTARTILKETPGNVRKSVRRYGNIMTQEIKSSKGYYIHNGIKYYFEFEIK